MPRGKREKSVVLFQAKTFMTERLWLFFICLPYCVSTFAYLNWVIMTGAKNSEGLCWVDAFHCMFVCLQIVNNRLSSLHDWAMRNVTSSLGKTISRAVRSMQTNPSVTPRSNTTQRQASLVDVSSALIFLCRLWLNNLNVGAKCGL